MDARRVSWPRTAPSLRLVRHALRPARRRPSGPYGRSLRLAQRVSPAGTERPASPYGDVSTALRSPSGPTPRPPRPRRDSVPTLWKATALFDSSSGHGCTPQIDQDSSVHMLGTGKLSRWLPQVDRPKGHQPRSAACGFVANTHPQGVDRGFVHRGVIALSTVRPQVARACPQLLHTPVHCSARRHPRSPGRVKGVTPRCRIGLWGTGVKLGTGLGRSRAPLCIGCA